MPGIFVDDGGGELIPMSSARYLTELELQDLLAKNPALLLGEEPDGEGPRYLLIKQEAGVPGAEGEADRWSLDHLFVDRAGVPTLVEVKRAGDTRARREVVAQMLDYAANISSWWPPDRMREEFEASSVADADERVVQFSGMESAEAFWTAVKTNLAAITETN